MLVVLSWFGVITLLGASFYPAAYMAKQSLPFEYMMFYRMMLSSAILLLYLVIRRQRILIKKNEILLSILVASSQLNVWLSGMATKYIISGLVPCILLTQIFTAELICAIYEKRKMKKNIIISGILGTIGIFMLCNQQLSSFGNTDIKQTLLGIALAFISTFASAIGNLIYEKGGKNIQEMPKPTFLLYNCFFAGLFFLLIGLIVYPFNELTNPVLFDKTYLLTLLFLSAGPTILFLFGMYYIIAKQGSVKITYVNFFAPILSMVISTIFENFKWNNIPIIGMLLLLISVWVGIKQKR